VNEAVRIVSIRKGFRVNFVLKIVNKTTRKLIKTTAIEARKPLLPSDRGNIRTTSEKKFTLSTAAIKIAINIISL
jgi:hypothetical protein